MKTWISKDPGRCGGDACIRNTRLTVWGLAEWKRLGWTDAKILDAFPQLTKHDLDLAWFYLAENEQEVDEAVRENQEA